jgi:radical SAM superfamily enzyme
VKQVRQAVGWCRKYNVRYFFTIMLNLPTETEDDLHQTWALLKELKPDGVAVNVATPFPGTSMHKHYSCGLKKEDYHLLMDNVLEPMERFRMAAHHKDLAKLRRKWCREFKATPMFERMWCFGRARSLYWGAVLGSARRGEYIRRWIADLPRTFLSYWARRMGLL